MCSLDEIPFKDALECVETNLDEKNPVGDPEIKIPDCTQILRDTKYSFTLEKRIMAACEELQRKNRKAKKLPQSVCPTCPTYWLMFSSPQQSRVGRSGNRESWEMGPRPRSLSLNAADSNRLRPLRAVQFLIADSDFEGGYGEDDERSSTEEDASRSKKRPQSSGPQSKVHIQRGSTPHTTRPGSSSTRPSSASALKETRKPLPLGFTQTPQGSPHTSRAPRRKPAVVRTGGRRSSHSLQQRPSPAGPLPSPRQQKPTSHVTQTHC